MSSKLKTVMMVAGTPAFMPAVFQTTLPRWAALAETADAITLLAMALHDGRKRTAQIWAATSRESHLTP